MLQGFYFTRTNVSKELFGEGSFDKGFYFQIPLDLFSNNLFKIRSSPFWEKHLFGKNLGSLFINLLKNAKFIRIVNLLKIKFCFPIYIFYLPEENAYRVIQKA